MPPKTTTRPKTTAPRTRATRKPAPPDTCRLVIVIRGEHYTARPFRAETTEVIRAWRLRKADGTVYDVADTIDGATCECADHVFRHDGNGTACKHIRACRALGLIDPDGDHPSDWPSWTDTHAFTTGR